MDQNRMVHGGTQTSGRDIRPCSHASCPEEGGSFKASGFELRASGLRFWAQGFGFSVQSFEAMGFKVLNPEP